MRQNLRDRLAAALKEAMKARDQARLPTLRLINAAIKDRDIAVRGDGRQDGISDDEILAVLSRMVRQREESARAYEEGGRLDLAEGERNEIEVVGEFLPRALSAEEQRAAISRAIEDVGADSVRDMGRIMATLKARYPGQMDFAAAGSQIKEHLCNG